MAVLNTVSCKICNNFAAPYIGTHVTSAHGMTLRDYAEQHGPLACNEIASKVGGKGVRKAAPEPTTLKVKFADLSLSVNIDVPESVCLPLPPNYQMPTKGDLGKDVAEASIALACRRSTYIWGLPGSGKDAFIHAFSYMTRTPAMIFTVQPGEDIQSWFYTRAFDTAGTSWEEGELLKALRDGYKSPVTGRVVPYMILISDFDRATKAQAEALRLVMDSISGRVKGPNGVTYNVLEGTQIVVTANSAGSGDTRGRCISSNPIDASILDRFQRKFEFHWMEWTDEAAIVKSKYPVLATKHPEFFDKAGLVTSAIRKAIQNEEIHAEFSHRALCSWLGHAEDIVRMDPNGKDTLARAARVIFDGAGDEETRVALKRLVDPHVKGIKV
jgi:MoxR-like ATPase